VVLIWITAIPQNKFSIGYHAGSDEPTVGPAIKRTYLLKDEQNYTSVSREGCKLGRDRTLVVKFGATPDGMVLLSGENLLLQKTLDF